MQSGLRHEQRLMAGIVSRTRFVTRHLEGEPGELPRRSFRLLHGMAPYDRRVTAYALLGRHVQARRVHVQFQTRRIPTSVLASVRAQAMGARDRKLTEAQIALRESDQPGSARSATRRCSRAYDLRW